MPDPTTTPKPIEVFKPGRWTANNGETIEYSEADLRKAAEVYDPAKHEAPIVIGHPKINNPAFGWAERFEFKDGKLLAIPHQVDPAFAAEVNAGRYKKVSIRWFRPEAPNNPVPGAWYPEHIGFLGAAAPGVQGLRPAAFAADTAGLVEFSAPAFSVVGLSLADALRRLRDWLIGDRGLEVADQVLPNYLVSNIELEAARELDAAPSPAYTAPRPATEDPMTTPAHLPATPPATPPAPPATAPSADDLAKREQQLAVREAELDRASFSAFVDKLIGEGKALPAHKDFLVGFMASLPKSATVEFSQGDSKVSQPSLVAFQAYLAGQPQVVELGEIGKVPVDQAPTTQAPAFAAPPGFTVEREDADLYAKATAYQAKHPGTDIVTAYKAVGGK